MKANVSRWLAVVVSLTLPLAPPMVRGEDPPPADSGSNQAAAPGDKLNRNSIDLSNAQFSLLDLSESLVAANALGIDTAAPEGALRAQLGLEEGVGLVVTGAPDESPGAKSGLKLHDVIVQLGDEKVGDAAKLGELLGAAAGKPLRITLLRAGKKVQIDATPKKPQLASLALKGWVTARDAVDGDMLVTADRYRIGVTLSEADDALRAQLRLAAGEGLVVTEIVSDSPAEYAGIKHHDVLTVLDGKRLTTVEAINAQIQEIKDKSVELRLLRGGKELAIQIAPRKTQEAAFTDKPLVYWDTRSCRSCHADPHATINANALNLHRTLAGKLGADHSVWTDGHHAKLFLYEKVYQAQTAAALKAPQAQQPQQQIEALKGQLAEMQKTLAALEAALAQPPKPEEKK